MYREPAVAGSFYSGNEKSLRRDVELYVVDVEKKSAVAVVAPHAGYPYSGRVAGEVYSRVEIPERIVLLGPKHSWTGEPFAIMTEGFWKMPFGNVEVDSELGGYLEENCDFLIEDTTAHQREHCLEVQLPFVQYFRPDVKIVPIVIGSSDLELLRELGEWIARGAETVGRGVLLVASTDMSHTQGSNERLQKKINEHDMMAINAVLGLDEERFFRTIKDYDVTMCGYAPTAAVIVASKKLGASKGSLVKYATSWDVTRDYSYVVGYAGVIID